MPIRIVFYGQGEFEGGKPRADATAAKALELIRQLNLVFSDYRPDSELRQVCVAAQDGSPVHVSDDFWAVLIASKEYFRLSNGAFDPTVSGAVKLWRRAAREGRFPRKDLLDEARRLTNFNLVELDPQKKTMRFREKGIRLDFGGIAKGYIIDRTLELLAREGFPAALVDAGGDVGLSDPPPKNEHGLNNTDEKSATVGWKIGILDSKGNMGDDFRYLSRCAIATSGDTNRYAEIDGVKYSHIINPKTGIGLTHSAVTTVIAPTATDADAWASARSVDPSLPETLETWKRE